MRFVMMDADERFSQSECERLTRFETDEQRRGQSRSLRCGNGIELRGSDASLAQSGLRYGQKVSQMFARGKFRNDAAIFSVHLDLRRNHGGANHAIAHDGGTGFIAGSFERE